MSKVYVYRHKDDTVTIYCSKDFPESKGIPVFEYEGEIPEGSGLLKTDGVTLYLEPYTEESYHEPTTEETLLELAADHEARLCNIELGV